MFLPSFRLLHITSALPVTDSITSTRRRPRPRRTGRGGWIWKLFWRRLKRVLFSAMRQEKASLSIISTAHAVWAGRAGYTDRVHGFRSFLDFLPFPFPAASKGFFVAVASGTLYTETCYAVTPCADTAHTPARVRELAAMKRIIVLALLTFLCSALRASSRM